MFRQHDRGPAKVGHALPQTALEGAYAPDPTTQAGRLVVASQEVISRVLEQLHHTSIIIHFSYLVA
ncbi:hypothetical protein D9M70_513700 [compost metagenome]